MSSEIAKKENGAEAAYQSELSMDIIKKYVCPTATEQEIYTFLQLCKVQHLNPFLKEVYLIKYGSAPATIVTGKETFTKRADKLPQYDGFKAGIIVLSGGKVVYREGSFYTESEHILGGWAEVYRKDRAIPFRNEVKLEEYEGKKADGTVNKMWAEKKATMIRKVPLMQSLREAFPDAFGGLYSAEEINAVDTLPNYEIGKQPIVDAPSVKTPQSKPAQATGHPATTTGELKVTTGIEKITQKKDTNKTTGQEFTLYKIHGEGDVTYSTFDTKLATLAKTASEAGLKIEITYKADKFNSIVAIDIIEPTNV